MKKVWIIRGTNGEHFHENKLELKKVRDKLNKEQGFDLNNALASNGGNIGKATALMPFKIVKGPDHPRYEA
jgi:hypothetical protein